MSSSPSVSFSIFDRDDYRMEAVPRNFRVHSERRPCDPDERGRIKFLDNRAASLA